MRRFASILLLLVACMGPLSALLPGSDEAQLPACCRRHGAHHCAMSPDGAAHAATGGHTFSAPRQCPLFHRTAPAPTGVFTVTASIAVAHEYAAERVIAAAQRAALQPVRTAAGRGPPAFA